MSLQFRRDRRRWSATERAVGLWLGVLVLEASLVLGYFAVTTARPSDDLRYLAYPFLWIDAGVWAVRRVEPAPRNRLHRAAGIAVAAAYLLAVLWVPGTIGLGAAGTPVDLRIAMAVPGWGPVVAFTSPWLRAYLVPFEVVGYAALSYLVYANALALARRAFSALLGLATCVGCTVPVLAPIVGLLGGPAAGLTTTYAWSYDLGTGLFLLAVWLLAWGGRRARS